MNADDLRAWRDDHDHMTQEQLARELGLTRQTIYYWERGKRPMPGRWLDLALEALHREWDEEREAEAIRNAPLHPMENVSTPFVSLLRRSEAHV